MTTTKPPAPHADASTGGFVHLHVHTEFSKQDSIARLGPLVRAAKADGQTAIASTDHGTTAGAYKFVKECKKAGVKPILGVEAYMALVPDSDWKPENIEDPSVRAADEAAAAAGVPLAMRPGSRFRRTEMEGMDAESGALKKNRNNHLTILVKNQTGWRNLCAMLNKAEESFFYKPLIDYALLKEHGEGLIVLSGCLGGPVASHVAQHGVKRREAAAIRERIELRARLDVAALEDERKALLDQAATADGDASSLEEAQQARLVEIDALLAPLAGSTPESDNEEAAQGAEASAALDLAQAKANLGYLIECVGRENVYVEIMEHGLEAEGRDHIKTLAALADEARVELVATNDSHFVECDDDDAHDSWLLVGELARGAKTSKDDPDRWRFNGAGYWLRSEAEMRALYDGKRWQEACDNTVKIAERIDADVIPTKPLRLPRFPVPAEVVEEWNNGSAATVTDVTGKEFPAKQVGKRAYRTPSSLYLHQLVKEGAKRRYGGLSRADVRERLGFEFDVVTALQIEDYLLIVRDVIEWCASDRGMPTPEHPLGRPAEYDADGVLVPGTGKVPILVGPGRGSAAGSAISYCIDIVQVDPLRWGLLFERFLDIDRIGMPDIDVDFESARRNEVYDYLAARYDKFVEVRDISGNIILDEDGKPVVERQRYVARIGAFQVAKTKRAIKDAARVIGDHAAGETLAKLVPVHQGKPQSFAFLFEEPTDRDGLADPNGTVVHNPEATEFRAHAAEPRYAPIVALARAFEDVVAGEGIHAAGAIVSDEPLDDLIPMRRDRKAESDVPIALWDGKDIDSFGMLKLDALSIDNLDYLAAAVKHIARTRGETVDPGNLPDPDDLSDPRVVKTYELLRNGGTEGVFQMESPGLTELTVSAAPSRFEDISALLALYRPGPMGANMHTLFAERKTGRAPVDYGIFTDDPAETEIIASVLGDTQGVIVYQEQLMFLAGRVAGFSALERSDLRKAVSKKIATEVERLGVIFMEQGQQEMTLEDGTHKIAFRKETLERLWTTFQASAAYLFNKSHTVAYGYLSYVTAYFSANYPVEFAAGVLGVSKKKVDKRLATLRAMSRRGIKMLPPDVNRSMADTAPDLVDPTAVRPGLTEIRDVGNNGYKVVLERERNGDFTSMLDVARRVKVEDKDGKPAKLSVSVIEGLIEAGAFDALHGNRLGLMKVSRVHSNGIDLPVPDAEWSPLERSARQRHRLGMAVGDHPLVAYSDALRHYVFSEREDRWGNLIGGKPIAVHKVADRSSGGVITLGVLTQWAEKTTRSGSKMANFALEGTQGAVSGVMFSDAIRSMAAAGMTPHVGDIVALAGQVKVRTVTFLETDEDGEEVEATHEVRELIGSIMEVVDVDASPSILFPEVEEGSRFRLDEAIEWAKARTAEPTLPDEPSDGAPDADLVAVSVDFDNPVDVDLSDLVDFNDLDAPQVAPPVAPVDDIVDLDDELDDDTHGRPKVDETGWSGIVAVPPANGLTRISNTVVAGRVLRETGDQTEKEAFYARYQLGTGKDHRPASALNSARDMVFRVEGGCATCCTSCTLSGDECVHHGGTKECNCVNDCAKFAADVGTFSLVIATQRSVVNDPAAVRRVAAEIDPASPHWVRFPEYPRWSSAPLSAFQGTAG